MNFSKKRTLALAVMAMGTLSVTGCMGIIPNSNSQAAQEKLTESHSVEVEVAAPFGSTVSYVYGMEGGIAETDNLNAWSDSTEVEGIKDVKVAVEPKEEGLEGTVTCSITIDGKEVAKEASIDGVSGAIECVANTSGV